MSKPTILAVDDDPDVSAAITRDLRGRYATGYRIVRATSGPNGTFEVRVVGHRWSGRSHDVKMFLAGNYVPYRWYDIERDAEARRLRGLARAAPADLPPGA